MGVSGGGVFGRRALPSHVPARIGLELRAAILRAEEVGDGRPTDEQVRAYRAMTPEQMARKIQATTATTPMKGRCSVISSALIRAPAKPTSGRPSSTAVKFYDDCSHYFKWDGDFWDCVVRAVAQAANKYPFYLDTTYRDARNNLAYS